MLAAESLHPSPAPVMLAEALGLSRFELDVVLLCAAAELDTGVAGLCAAAQGDGGRPYPTLAVALALLPDPDWSAVTPGAPLRAWALVDLDALSTEPLTARRLRLDERVLHFVKGLNVLDESLAALTRPLAVVELAAPSQVEAAGRVCADLGAHRIVQLVGRNRSSRRAVAAHAAELAGLQVLEMDAVALPTLASDVEHLARTWRRESRLLPIALLIDADHEQLEHLQVAALRRLAAAGEGPLLVSARETCVELAGESRVHDIATPTRTEQRALWSTALRSPSGDASSRLSASFDLDGAEIVAMAGGGDGDRAHEVARSLSRPQLDALAERRNATVGWDDLVLAAEPLRLLRSIADQARQRSVVYDDWGWRRRSDRGLGITALFSGESGTGKTLAAEVLAADLGLDLYRIDLAGVVSKYIGETEKNLRRLFDAAEHGGVMLLFDEADALFGKRSEVKDSHDRYANIEVNYLLQRMESFQGVAVLATNVRSALDSAFTRRLRFIVSFTLPGVAERERMWARAFPPDVPKAGIDAGRLARLNVSGAVIHTIALHAAFAAAAAGTPVTMELVLAAARTELRKADRPTNEVEAL